jgi:mono/diheme cytochrome c family protein
MSSTRALALALCPLLACVAPALAADTPDAKLAGQAHDILQRCCARCHGDKGSHEGKIDYILDPAKLLANTKIVAGEAGKSKVYKKIVTGDMPPEDEKPRPTKEEIAVLEQWIKAGAPAVPQPAVVKPAPPALSPAILAARVKEIFRSRCLQCHGGSKTNAGIKILDHDLLVHRKAKVVPGKPDASELYQLITASDDSVMPPAGQPRLGQADIDLVRQWIVAGAPPFPADVDRPVEKDKDKSLKDVVGVDYVLKKILAHVRTLPPADRRFIRYFSINHLLSGGATRAELDLQRDALAKAINHLSWEPALVSLVSIDEPVNSVFAIDLRQLGWNKQPFDVVRDGKVAGHSTWNLFDLVLLEYPYAVVYEDSETYDRLAEEYLRPSGMVRPIPYLRAGWFVSTATQSPLYEDLLQLPFDLKELETSLGVDSAADVRDAVARRAGMAVSGVSNNNRVVERHPMRYGAYWKSFDFRSSKGQENVFKDPIHLHPTGGEMIFNLPNGLQGYYVANGKGERLNAAPTEIVTDKFAEDKTVRNGLSCIRCHDQGLKGFEDAIRPALKQLPGAPGFDKQAALALYPPQAEMDGYVREDGERFRAALTKVLGRPQVREPLIPVTQRFLDGPLQLGTAVAELGLADPSGLPALFRTPQFAGMGLIALASEGVVRRDMWEDYYDQVVRQLGTGVPIVPLDGLNRRDFAVSPTTLAVDLKTSKRNNVFEPGDELAIFVTNKSHQDIHIELIGSSTTGNKVILTPGVIVVKAGQQYRFPTQGTLKVQRGLGKEQITLFAGFKVFPPGVLLRGKGVTDRVVHPFYDLRREDARLLVGFDPAQMVKKTIDIETK